MHILSVHYVEMVLSKAYLDGMIVFIFLLSFKHPRILFITRKYPFLSLSSMPFYFAVSKMFSQAYLFFLAFAKDELVLPALRLRFRDCLQYRPPFNQSKNNLS